MEFPIDWDKLEDLLGGCSSDKAAEERLVLTPHLDHHSESKDQKESFVMIRPLFGTVENGANQNRCCSSCAPCLEFADVDIQNPSSHFWDSVMDIWRL